MENQQLLFWDNRFDTCIMFMVFLPEKDSAFCIQTAVSCVKCYVRKLPASTMNWPRKPPSCDSSNNSRVLQLLNLPYQAFKPVLFVSHAENNFRIRKSVEYFFEPKPCWQANDCVDILVHWREVRQLSFAVQIKPLSAMNVSVAHGSRKLYIQERLMLL